MNDVHSKAQQAPRHTSVTSDRRDKGPRSYCSRPGNATAPPGHNDDQSSMSLRHMATAWQCLYHHASFLFSACLIAPASPLYHYLLPSPLTTHPNVSFPFLTTNFYIRHGVYNYHHTHPSPNNQQAGPCPACPRNALLSKARCRARYHAFPPRVVRKHCASHALSRFKAR